MGVSYVADISANYRILIDEQSGVSYIGKAAPGSVTSAPVWQIQRLTQTDTSLAVEFAGGNDEFTKIWDARASLAYS